MYEYLSKKDLQEKLGMSVKQVKALFLQEDFPYTKIGNQKFIRTDLFDEWMSTHIGEENAVKLDYSKV